MSNDTPQISALLGGTSHISAIVSTEVLQQNKQAGTRKKRPEAEGKTTAPAAQEFEKVNYTLPKELAQNIRTLAWYQRKEIRQVTEEALRHYLTGPAAGDLVKAVKEQKGRA